MSFFNYRKIGGLRFLRIGSLQISWCRLRPKAMRHPSVAELRRVTGQKPKGGAKLDAA